MNLIHCAYFHPLFWVRMDWNICVKFDCVFSWFFEAGCVCEFNQMCNCLQYKSLVFHSNIYATKSMITVKKSHSEVYLDLCRAWVKLSNTSDSWKLLLVVFKSISNNMYIKVWNAVTMNVMYLIEYESRQ